MGITYEFTFNADPSTRVCSEYKVAANNWSEVEHALQEKCRAEDRWDPISSEPVDWWLEAIDADTGARYAVDLIRASGGRVMGHHFYKFVRARCDELWGDDVVVSRLMIGRAHPPKTVFRVWMLILGTRIPVSQTFGTNAQADRWAKQLNCDDYEIQGEYEE